MYMQYDYQDPISPIRGYIHWKCCVILKQGLQMLCYVGGTLEYNFRDIFEVQPNIYFKDICLNYWNRSMDIILLKQSHN